MKRLDRYVLREMSVPTLSATLIVAGLFAGNELIALYQQLNASNVPFLTMMKLVFLSMPRWLTFTFPTGVAMGCSLAISRLSREGEMTAMRAAGIPIRRILLMVWFCGFAFAGLTFWMAEYVAPAANKEHSKLSVESMIVSGLPNMESNVMIRLNPYLVSFREMRRVGDDKLALSDVLLVKWNNVNEAVVFLAPLGTYDAGTWRFPKPYAWFFSGDGLVDVHDSDEIVLNQKIEIQDMMPSVLPVHQPKEEVWARIVAGRAAGVNVRQLEVQFYERFAVPAACLVFALASAMISIRFSKASAFQGLMLSLTMALAYYNVHMVCTTIVGPNGWLPPMWATWLPVGLFGLAALVAGSRLE